MPKSWEDAQVKFSPRGNGRGLLAHTTCAVSWEPSTCESLDRLRPDQEPDNRVSKLSSVQCLVYRENDCNELCRFHQRLLKVNFGLFAFTMN